MDKWYKQDQTGGDWKCRAYALVRSIKKIYRTISKAIKKVKGNKCLLINKMNLWACKLLNFNLSVMIKNYFKTAWCDIVHNKSYAIINIPGLALGMSCFILLTAHVQPGPAKQVSDQANYPDHCNIGPTYSYLIGRLKSESVRIW